MKPPNYNKEGFWRQRKSYLKAIDEYDRKVKGMEENNTWRDGIYPPSLDLDSLPPPTILVGRRRAKRMRNGL